jgi:hypothetical protein
MGVVAQTLAHAAGTHSLALNAGDQLADEVPKGAGKFGISSFSPGGTRQNGFHGAFRPGKLLLNHTP